VSPARGGVQRAPIWGFDLGGSKLAAAVLAAPPGARPATPVVLAEKVWPLPGRRPQDLRACLLSAAQTLWVAHGAPRAAGLAVAAAVSPTGAVGASPNLDAPGGGVLGGWLAEATGGLRPCVVNDGNAFLHAELQGLPGALPECAVGIVLGTGVGGALALAGRVRTGPQGLAGEWGHLPPPREADARALAVPCGCGRLGCIDALLGGRGWLWTVRACGVVVDSPEAAVAALRSGDPAASAAAADYRERLARALALWTDLLDPDCILIGGGLAAVPELVGGLGPLVAAARHGAMPAPRITAGRLGQAAPAIGAALIAAGIGTD